MMKIVPETYIYTVYLAIAGSVFITGIGIYQNIKGYRQKEAKRKIYKVRY
jgi:hypothetical protein